VFTLSIVFSWTDISAVNVPFCFCFNKFMSTTQKLLNIPFLIIRWDVSWNILHFVTILWYICTNELALRSLWFIQLSLFKAYWSITHMYCQLQIQLHTVSPPCSTNRNQFIYVKSLEKPYVHILEVFKDRQKFMIKQSESGRTSFLLIKNETRNTKVLPWIVSSQIQIESPFRCTSLQHCISLIKIVRFRSNHGQLEWNQTSMILSPFITNRQATYLKRFHRQLMQTLLKRVALNNFYLAFAFQSVLKCNWALLFIKWFFRLIEV